MVSIETSLSFPFSELQRKQFVGTNGSQQWREPSQAISVRWFLRSTKPIGTSIRESRVQILQWSEKNSRNGCFWGPVSSAGSCLTSPEESDSTESHSHLVCSNGLLRNAGLISLATTFSKLLGLLRELVLAASFGVGPVATAFNYALVLPRFFASLLGGVNGPVHIIMTTTLSKLSKENRRQVVQNGVVVMFLVGTILGVFVYMFAESITYVSAPGLWTSTEGRLTREIAITQLKLLTPCIFFAGLVGLGFGSLSAEGDNITPALSPSLSSIAIIISCAIHLLINGSNPFALRAALSGGMLISCGASIGAFLQWLVQVILHEKKEFRFTPFLWKNLLKDKDVHKLFALILPATLRSGLAQIASSTDLYFASSIPGAAAGLSYSHLLAMAPLGIFSSSIVVPLLPTLSGLAKPSSWSNLKKSLQQAVIFCMVIILPVTAVMCALAESVVNVIFQRFAFDSAATTLVSSLLICHSIGSPFYVVRELLVAVFYALGDVKRPFMISVIAVILNIFLDWLLTFRFGLGAQGLVMSTSLIAALSTLALLCLLSKNLRGLINFEAFICPLLVLLACCIISGFTAQTVHRRLQYMLSSVSIFRSNWLSDLLSIFASGVAGMFGFFLPLVWFKFPGLELVNDLFKTFFFS